MYILSTNLIIINFAGGVDLSERFIQHFCMFFSEKCVEMFKIDFVLSEG